MTLSPRKEKLINVAVVIGGFFVAFVLAEVVLRVFFPAHVTPDRRLGWIAHQGGGWDVRGWRNALPLDQANIVAIGDSMTMGDDVTRVTREEAWPQVLGSLASTSVYQMALGGYGPVQYDELLDEAIPLHPKIVLVGFYLGNDLYDVYRMVYERDAYPELRDPSFTPSPWKFQDNAGYSEAWNGVDTTSRIYQLWQLTAWPRLHSRIWGLLNNGVWLPFANRMGWIEVDAPKLERMKTFSASHPEITLVYPDPGLETVLNSGYRLNTVKLDTNTLEAWRIAQNRFRDMDQRLTQEGVRFVIVIIPTKEMVYETHMRSAGESLPSGYTGIFASEMLLRKEIFTFCEEAHISCIDTLPDLAKKLDEKVMIYQHTIDGHPNAMGYDAIAKTVYQYIKKHKFL